MRSGDRTQGQVPIDTLKAQDQSHTQVLVEKVMSGDVVKASSRQLKVTPRE